MITVSGLQKSYGKVTALRDVSFHIEPGEIIALLGGNGSGKSTSINILTGLLKADGGTVKIQGIDPFINPIEARKKLGVFPDKAGLFPHLTAREHLKFFAGAYGFSNKALDHVVDRVIDLLDMSEIADRETKGFSQGQTVKVALARAMVHKPEYLVLDEPSRGLDVFAVRQLRKLLLRLRDEGTGILFSSHVMQEIELLADRMAIISDGIVCAEGTPRDLKEKAGKDTLEDAFMALVEKGASNATGN
ncbi:MAG: ABC transporter ATP-binding protein [Kordiimonadaceae bacterium]|nr:ABC transporter ATP-binding protein [Kordiimonadaceae bacterium]